MSNTPLTILLVEDDPDHAELVRRNLESLQVASRLVHVPNGEEAMDYLHGCRPAPPVGGDPLPNLVLLDLRLPRVDGLEVLREIKSDPSLSSLPVVILTTSDAESDVARAYQCHANSYLIKPISFDAFSQLLRDLGLFWLVWNKCPW